ncbi:MAG: hypothetical protein KAS84_04740 [Anaerolineales bacterium]|nr:hypothetical protein [Anaerolineales bacterium]
MIFILIFLILAPGLISLLIHRELISRKNKTLETIAIYSIYSFCIILIFYIISYINNPNDNINLSINNDSDLYRVSFILKYMVLALNASVILPALLYLIKIVNWYLKKLALLKTQKPTDFIINDYSKQINEYVFGNADFYLNLSVKEIQDLVLFINKTILHKGKLYLFAPEYDLKVNLNQLDIEKITSENISNASLLDNDALLLIGDQIQENNLENITTKFQSQVFRLTFEEDSLNNDKGNLLLLPNHFNEKNQNTKYVQELLLQSLLGYVFTLIQ